MNVTTRHDQELDGAPLACVRVDIDEKAATRVSCTFCTSSKRSSRSQSLSLRAHQSDCMTSIAGGRKASLLSRKSSEYRLRTTCLSVDLACTNAKVRCRFVQVNIKYLTRGTGEGKTVQLLHGLSINVDPSHGMQAPRY